MTQQPIEVLAVCHALRDNFNVYRPEAAQIAGIHASGRSPHRVHDGSLGNRTLGDGGILAEMNEG